MALSPNNYRHLLRLLFLLSLLFLTHARLSLDNSDHKAFSIIQKHLGINGQRNLSATPCGTPGVFCERRISSNNTYVLKITRLVFKSQRLTGFLSPAIGRLTEVKVLSLPNNQLFEHVPPQIVNCKKLEVLELGNNQFSGEVPPQLSSLVRLRVLDLSFNLFQGNLSFLKHFPNLETLSLANNHFTGKVPKSIRSFRNLQYFDFSGNSFLEGPVPEMRKIESSGPQYPKRYMLAQKGPARGNNNSSSAASGPAATRSSSPTDHASSPSATAHKHNKGKRKANGWVLGFLAGSLAGSLSGFVFSVMFKLILAAVTGGRRGAGPAIFSPKIIKNAGDLAFLEKDDGLESLEIIGSGGCGKVYKAELPGGKLIAIKKIVRPQKDTVELAEEDSRNMDKKMRQIRSEINTVGQIRHRNLLPLLAHVTKSECHFLVYEFMKNGSLQDVLNQVSQGTRKLDWSARHSIASGVATGLEYLHMNHNPRIIHRDLKPANILLDDDMEARIADFGLAKAMPDAYTHITASNVAGTVGYIAPEYHQTLKFTEKCDIYSFGVLLGVLVMGKLPSDEFFQNTREMSLVKWMRNIMTSENPSQAIDPKLKGNGAEEQMLLVLKIACFCTLEDPKGRPNSKDVRCMLSQIKPIEQQI
uniref:Leucine-rich repeat transmembrane protein kinase n=1 Tax=Rhizophora mucronata TaxID=61149 RepID=A0A2P2KBK6_RHIMU